MTPILLRAYKTASRVWAKMALGRQMDVLSVAPPLATLAIVLSAWLAQSQWEARRAALIGVAPAPPVFSAKNSVATAAAAEGKRAVRAYAVMPNRSSSESAADVSPFRGGSSALLLTVTLAVAALTLNLILSLLSGRKFAKPIKKLQARAEQLAAGTAIEPGSTGVAEFDALNASLVQASKVLRGREDRQKRAEDELRDSEEQFRLLADSVPQLVWTARPDGRIDYANARRENYGSGGVSRTDWEAIIRPDDRRATVEAWLRASEAAAPYEREHRLMVAGKGYRWHLSRAAPMLDPSGVVVRWYGTTTDINDHKLREERICSLVAEVNHRSRNLLAVAQSIAHQTVKDGESARDFEQRYSRRLFALVASQNLLTEHQWSGVALAALLASLTRHPQESVAARVVGVGAPILLSPSAVQTLGLAIHELFSNAVKYGALSNDVGSVEVTWRVNESDLDSQFEMEWRERGGPPIRGNPTLGFGSVLIVRIVAQGVGGNVDLRFEPDGVVWRLSAPIDGVVVAEEQRFRSVSPEFSSVGEH